MTQKRNNSYFESMISNIFNEDAPHVKARPPFVDDVND